MSAILNIGLDVGAKQNVINPLTVLDILDAMGVTNNGWEVMNSDTERTVVVRINRPLSAQEGHALAVVLRQEAIAQYANGKGKAFGPQSGRWVFNPQYFFMLDGTRLSEQQS